MSILIAMPVPALVLMVVMPAISIVVPTVTILMMIMMVTMCIRIILQIALCKYFCRSVRWSLHTGIELDSGVSECHLSSHSDTTANQSVCLQSLQETS